MKSDTKMKKLLLMGRSGAGKTSMHSIIFANYPAKDTIGLGFTVDINEAKFKFMGNLTLNLWDCGGQEKLMKQYFTSQKDIIFKNVEVLIYVFDVESDGEDLQSDMNNYIECIKNLSIYSKNANIFILIHKMDRIKDSEKSIVFENKKKGFQFSLDIKAVSGEMNVQEVFATSIWDETLYKAWSNIVQILYPNIEYIKNSLKQLCILCDCDEIVLFEKSTFLIIAYHENREDRNILKYERLSNIIKQFKLSCNKIGAQIKQVVVKNSKFTSFIEEFTDNTYIMVVFSDQKIRPAAIEMNIEFARRKFDKSQPELEQLQQNWKMK